MTQVKYYTAEAVKFAFLSGYNCQDVNIKFDEEKQAENFLRSVQSVDIDDPMRWIEVKTVDDLPDNDGNLFEWNVELSSGDIVRSGRYQRRTTIEMLEAGKKLRFLYEPGITKLKQQ